MDDIVHIQEIANDRKRKVIMQRTTKKRRLNLEISILIITDDKFISTENAKTSDLIGVGWRSEMAPSIEKGKMNRIWPLR
jgi:hypothetical protein